MRIDNIENYWKGWFIGNFMPAFYRYGDCEIGIKKYKAGDEESAHYHKIATEITMIVSGSAMFNEDIFTDGTIVEISPGEINKFKAITDVTTLVVKFPSQVDDKYEV